MNLAGDPAHAAVLSDLRAQAAQRWDLSAYDAQVRNSQARSWIESRFVLAQNEW